MRIPAKSNSIPGMVEHATKAGAGADPLLPPKDVLFFPCNGLW
jgi:hypothetical protein